MKHSEKSKYTLMLTFLNGGWIKIIFFIIVSLSLILCLLFSNIDYARKTMYFPNVLLIINGIFLIIGIYKTIQVIMCYFFTSDIKNRYKIVFIFSILFTIAQGFAIYNYYFKTDWDASTIIDAAMDLANDNSMEAYEGYFSYYPNNMLLVFCYSIIIRIAYLIGLDKYDYFSVLFFQCLVCWVAGLLLFKSLLILRKSYSEALLGYGLYLLLIGLSPWFSIPYSDSMALFFPIMILWIYLQDNKKNNFVFLKWFLIAFLSIVGYKLKPQVFILIIAICIVKIALLIEYKIKKTQIKVPLAQMTGFLAGALIAVITCNSAVKGLNIDIDKEKSIGITHFLMLGMNPDAKGVWAKEDFDFSSNIETISERSKLNLEKTKERLESMGISGFLKQMHCKTLTNYNDGTFCWGGEGVFYIEMQEGNSSGVSRFFKNLYYNREHTGVFYSLWSNFEQSIWMTILITSLLSVFSKKREIQIVMLSIIGLSLFELIFEARARYLFIYAPFYIILCIEGISMFQLIIKQSKGRRIL